MASLRYGCRRRQGAFYGNVLRGAKGASVGQNSRICVVLREVRAKEGRLPYGLWPHEPCCLSPFLDERHAFTLLNMVSVLMKAEARVVRRLVRRMGRREWRMMDLPMEMSKSCSMPQRLWQTASSLQLYHLFEKKCFLHHHNSSHKTSESSLNEEPHSMR